MVCFPVQVFYIRAKRWVTEASASNLLATCWQLVGGDAMLTDEKQQTLPYPGIAAIAEDRQYKK